MNVIFKTQRETEENDTFAFKFVQRHCLEFIEILIDRQTSFQA